MGLWRWLVRLFRKRQPDPADPETRRQRDVAAADADRSADSRAGALPPVGGA
jgi:hypothetical protein